jgi:hypothetical protein
MFKAGCQGKAELMLIRTDAGFHRLRPVDMAYLKTDTFDVKTCFGLPQPVE